MRPGFQVAPRKDVQPREGAGQRVEDAPFVAVLGQPHGYLRDDDGIEQPLQRVHAGEHERLLEAGHLGPVDAGDAVPRLARPAVRPLGDQDEAAAGGGLEPFGERMTDEEPAVPGARQPFAVDLDTPQERDSFAGRVDADELDAAGLALAHDDRRHPHARRPAGDLVRPEVDVPLVAGAKPRSMLGSSR